MKPPCFWILFCSNNSRYHTITIVLWSSLSLSESLLLMMLLAVHGLSYRIILFSGVLFWEHGDKNGFCTFISAVWQQSLMHLLAALSLSSKYYDDCLDIWLYSTSIP
jgi:hypothetical protein